jgi:hypothetical protein
MFALCKRGGAASIAAALLAAGTFVVGSLATAVADQNGSAVATLGDFLHWGKVDIKGEGVAAGGTVALHEGQQQLAVYCIDLHHETENGVKY